MLLTPVCISCLTASFFEHQAVLEAMPEYAVIQAKIKFANFVDVPGSPRYGRYNKLLSEAFIEQLLCMFLRKGT